MGDPLATFIGVTVFYVALPFVCLSILCAWKKAHKNHAFPMYTWEFFLLACISAACLWLHWILAFLCQLNPLMGPILKKEHAETVIFAWESIDE